MVSSSELLDFLKSGEGANLKGLNRLKTVYRPYICPFDQILNLIPPESKVFDIGCGSGSLLSLIDHFCKPEKLGGIEIDDVLVENAKLLLSSSFVPVSVYKYDGVTIPEEIKEYDIITMIDVFHHIPKSIQLTFFDQLYQKMSTGSVLIYKDIDAKSFFVYANKLHDMVLAGEIGNEWKAKDLAANLKQSGFECSGIIYKQMIVYPHYTIVAKK